VLALLLACSILLYGVYTASWQWPWRSSSSRIERQSVQVSIAAAPASPRVPSAIPQRAGQTLCAPAASVIAIIPVPASKA
jgi:hypothetical protein